MDRKQLVILANDPEAMKSLKSVMQAAGMFSEERWQEIVRRVNAAKPDSAGRPVFYAQQISLIPGKDIEDLLCCALEGGSNYWYSGLDIESPPLAYSLHSWKEYLKEHNLHWHVSTPVFGGKISLFDTETSVKFLIDSDSLEKGLNIMASDYPFHWKSFVGDYFDADTGDVFLQCCIFDEVVYG